MNFKVDKFTDETCLSLDMFCISSCGPRTKQFGDPPCSRSMVALLLHNDAVLMSQTV